MSCGLGLATTPEGSVCRRQQGRCWTRGEGAFLNLWLVLTHVCPAWLGLCCWQEAAEAGIPSSHGQNGLPAHTHPSCFPELSPFPARWCPSWLAGCPGQLRTCRSCCRVWADTRREPSHPSRTDR